MNIKAMGSMTNNIDCQPIRGLKGTHGMAGLGKTAGAAAMPNFKADNCDTFTCSDSYTLEQKYDLACRLAAYYQTKYENLQKETGCCYV